MNFKRFKSQFEFVYNWKNKLELNKEINKIIQLKLDLFADDCKKYGFDVSDTISFEDLKKQLIAIRGDKKTCNIIGSGASALKVLDKYNTNESYFTCNFGGLLEIPFDVYLFEIGTYESDKPIVTKISELQKRVLKERQSETKNLFTKNIWEGKMDKQYLEDNYESYTVLRDLYMPRCNEIESNGYLNLLFKKMFNDKQFFILQVHTTILTLVQLAVWAGYKTINIYGLEGKGSHFFHKSDKLSNTNLVDNLKSVLPAVEDNHIHIPGYRARQLVAPMSKYLKKYNINLSLED